MSGRLIYTCDKCGKEADWETQHGSWSEVRVDAKCHFHKSITKNYCAECWLLVADKVFAAINENQST